MKGDGSVIDFLVHGGHQYEFFKSNRKFYCSYPDGSRPNPSDLGRPRNDGVDYVDNNNILLNFLRLAQYLFQLFQMFL